MAITDYIIKREDYGTVTLNSGYFGCWYAGMASASHPSNAYSGFILTHDAFAEVSVGPLASGMLSFNAKVSTITGVYPVITLRGATHDILRIVTYDSNERWRVQRWDGSAWVQVGTDQTSTLLNNGRRIDIKWNIDGAAGVFEVYIDRSLAVSYSGDTLVTDTQLEGLVLHGSGTATSYYNFFSPIVVDDTDTLGLYLTEETSIGAGDTSEYVGTEPNVDDPMGNPGTTFVVFDTENARGDFTMVPTGALITDAFTVEKVHYAVGAVGVGYPPFYVHGYARIGATNYDDSDSGLQPGLAASLEENLWALHFEFSVDPSTSLPWANKTAVDAAKFGMQVKSTA